MSEAVRFCLAGARRGASIARAVAAHPRAELALVCDLNPERATTVAAEFGAGSCGDIGSVLEAQAGERIDALIVATPPATHADISCRALRRGFHVMSEVPAVITLEEATLLAQAAAESDAVYMIAENVCFFGNIMTMHDLVRSGRIGAVYFAEGEYIHDCRKLFADRDDGLGGGVDGLPTWRAALPPIHYCTHELGPILMMTADPVVEAVGLDGGSHTEASFGASALETAIFRTRSGGIIRLSVGFAIEREPPFHFFNLYGTRGSVETDRYQPYDRLKAHFSDLRETSDLIDIPVSLARRTAPAEARGGGHGTSEFDLVDRFIRRIHGEPCDAPLLGVDEALNMSVPGICAHQSAVRGGAPVKVPVCGESGEEQG